MIDLIVYDDLEVVIELYQQGDLDMNQLAFPYYASPIAKMAKKASWIHQDELKKLVALKTAYPGSNTKKGQ